MGQCEILQPASLRLEPQLASTVLFVFSLGQIRPFHPHPRSPQPANDRSLHAHLGLALPQLLSGDQ